MYRPCGGALVDIEEPGLPKTTTSMTQGLYNFSPYDQIIDAEIYAGGAGHAVAAITN